MRDSTTVNSTEPTELFKNNTPLGTNQMLLMCFEISIVYEQYSVHL